MATGTVKYFNTTKGFGFITPEGGGADVFVHATAVELAGMSALAEGQRVSFDVETDQKGSKAVRLKRFRKAAMRPAIAPRFPPPPPPPAIWTSSSITIPNARLRATRSPRCAWRGMSRASSNI